MSYPTLQKKIAATCLQLLSEVEIFSTCCFLLYIFILLLPTLFVPKANNLGTTLQMSYCTAYVRHPRSDKTKPYEYSIMLYCITRCFSNNSFDVAIQS